MTDPVVSTEFIHRRFGFNIGGDRGHYRYLNLYLHLGLNINKYYPYLKQKAQYPLPYTCLMKPNIFLRQSVTEMNFWHICFTSVLSSLSWWIWHIAYAISHFSHCGSEPFFCLLKALMLLSAIAGETGVTKSNLTRVST